MIIENGDGAGGFSMKVDSQRRAHTFSTTEPEDKHVNREGHTWSLDCIVTPAGVDDNVFYIKNTGTKQLVVTDVRVKCAAPNTLTINVVSGVPIYIAGSDVAPISRNTGLALTPEATIKVDTDITGIVDDGRLFFIRCDTADKMEKLSTSSNIIIAQGKSIAIKSSIATAIDGVVSLAELDDL